MKKSTAWAWLIFILLIASLLRQYRWLDFPLHGDEVDEGDVAHQVLDGNLALFYPHNEGNEPLFHLVMAPFFAILGDSVIANRFPSFAWSMVFVALMYTYGRVLFRSRHVGVMAAGLGAILWFHIIFGRLGLREISQPVMMMPALIGLVIALRDPSEARARRAAIIGGIFAGLTSYTFLSGRGFSAVVVGFIAYLAVAQRELLRRRWRPLASFSALAFAGVIILFAYLHLNPSIDYHVQDLLSRSWLVQGSVDGLIHNLGATLGMFTVSGDMNWVRNIPGRPIFPGIEGILFYLGIALCIWRWRKQEFALQLIVIATFLVPNILTEDPPRWTRSIGILPGLIIVPTLPIEWAWARITQSTTNIRQRVWLNATSVLLVGLLGISILARTTIDMFGTWIDDPNIYWMTLAFYDGTGRYINQSTDTTPLNYVMDIYEPWRKHNIQRVIQRSDVAVRYSVLNALVFPDSTDGNRFVFQILGSPARPILEAFLDLNSPIYIDPRVEPEGRQLLRVYFAPRATFDEHLARASRNAVFVPDTATPLAFPIQFGDALQFAGYEILNPSAHAGDDMNVLTYWRVLKRPPNIAVFLHLVDRQDQIVAQFDEFQAIVDDLAPGDIVVQLHALKLPLNLQSGTYRFELGAYTRDDLQRLSTNAGTDYVWSQEWRPNSSK